ncbi:sulfite exporter TauE/SafE family protein [Dyadobacter pollutisoli]|uniref:Sulfite exporter TauE/SafE family protein n=1 Tax=Dyadobacter pollutisoli TaxID=2910158 RepID=A0A9E8NCD8_9BACT|nr:sulfite exporter TauE/SafE family protein [Dyadobacter pollutisoli]WAC14074.1 sulfite exporter TauE/SafE family protein [Dyadobacter pollutisoli]
MTTALPYLAFTMGLISSLHCVGMCGPIALALPVHKGSRLKQFSGLLLYNSGRALSYSSLGLLVGGIGASIGWLGYLRYLSVFAGLLMLAYVFWPSRLDSYFHPPVFWARFVHFLKQQMAATLQSRSAAGWLMLGIFNGLIPCGMVYMALMSSIATGSMAGSATYMMIFGLGTFPAMISIGIAKQKFTPGLRSRIRRFTPVMLAVAGIWLVMRGVLTDLPVNGESRTGITVCK